MGEGRVRRAMGLHRRLDPMVPDDDRLHQHSGLHCRSSAYIFSPSLAGSKPFVFVVIIAVWWVATFANFQGLKVYERLTSWFAIIGTFVPFAALVVGATIYLSSGHSPQIPLTPPSLGAMMPNFTSANNLVLLVTFVFFYIGIEMTAAHVNNLKRPSRDYPIAILIVSVVMAVISISGALILPGSFQPRTCS